MGCAGCADLAVLLSKKQIEADETKKLVQYQNERIRDLDCQIVELMDRVAVVMNQMGIEEPVETVVGTLVPRGNM